MSLLLADVYMYFHVTSVADVYMGIFMSLLLADVYMGIFHVTSVS